MGISNDIHIKMDTDMDMPKLIQLCSNKECGKAGTRKCSGCEQASYCGVECQTVHWKTEHKLECKKMKAKKSNEEEDETPKTNMCFIGGPWAPPGMVRIGIYFLPRL